jgi:hypothetical protein
LALVIAIAYSTASPHHGAALFFLQIKNLKTNLAEANGKWQQAGTYLYCTAQQPTTSKLWQQQTKTDNNRYWR